MSDPQPLPIKVTLIGRPHLPLETLWYVWHQSRHNGPMLSPEECAELRLVPLHWNIQSYLNMLKDARTEEHPEGYDPTPQGLALFKKEFDEVVSKILLEGIPASENTHFTFAIENLPIFAREQMVRHRIGTNFDGRIGVDIIPDLAQSSWWSQTARVINMGRFYNDGQWFLPQSADSTMTDSEVYHKGDKDGRIVSREEAYRGALKVCQTVYNSLIESGMPIEDARNVLPMAMSHRLTWDLNASSFKHIVGKRTCWIAQFGVWESIVSGMASELAEKVDPLFSKLVNPPCIKGDTWVSCPFNHTNVTRVQGTDPFPPCPLWLHHNEKEAIQTSADSLKDPGGPMWYPGEFAPSITTSPLPGGWVSLSDLQVAKMEEGRKVFRRFWNRDVDTGAPLV